MCFCFKKLCGKLYSKKNGTSNLTAEKKLKATKAKRKAKIKTREKIEIKIKIKIHFKIIWEKL